MSKLHTVLTCPRCGSTSLRAYLPSAFEQDASGYFEHDSLDTWEAAEVLDYATTSEQPAIEVHCNDSKRSDPDSACGWEGTADKLIHIEVGA